MKNRQQYKVSIDFPAPYTDYISKEMARHLDGNLSLANKYLTALKQKLQEILRTNNSVKDETDIFTQFLSTWEKKLTNFHVVLTITKDYLQRATFDKNEITYTSFILEKVASGSPGFIASMLKTIDTFSDKQKSQSRKEKRKSQKNQNKNKTNYYATSYTLMRQSSVINTKSFILLFLFMFFGLAMGNAVENTNTRSARKSLPGRATEDNAPDANIIANEPGNTLSEYNGQFAQTFSVEPEDAELNMQPDSVSQQLAELEHKQLLMQQGRIFITESASKQLITKIQHLRDEERNEKTNKETTVRVTRFVAQPRPDYSSIEKCFDITNPDKLETARFYILAFNPFLHTTDDFEEVLRLIGGGANYFLNNDHAKKPEPYACRTIPSKRSVYKFIQQNGNQCLGHLDGKKYSEMDVKIAEYAEQVALTGKLMKQLVEQLVEKKNELSSRMESIKKRTKIYREREQEFAKDVKTRSYYRLFIDCYQLYCRNAELAKEFSEIKNEGDSINKLTDEANRLGEIIATKKNYLNILLDSIKKIHSELIDYTNMIFNTQINFTKGAAKVFAFVDDAMINLRSNNNTIYDNERVKEFRGNLTDAGAVILFPKAQNGNCRIAADKSDKTITAEPQREIKPQKNNK